MEASTVMWPMSEVEYPRWVYSKTEGKIVNSAEEHAALGHGWHLIQPDEYPRSHPHDAIGRFIHHRLGHDISDDEITKKSDHHMPHQVFHGQVKPIRPGGRPKGSKNKITRGKKDEE